MIHRFKPTPALAFAAGSFTVMTVVAVACDLLVKGPGHPLFSFDSLFATEVSLGLITLLSLLLAVPFHAWFSIRADNDLLQAGMHGHRFAFALGLLCPPILALIIFIMFLVFGKQSWILYAIVGIFPPVISAELSVFYFRNALARAMVLR
jgi:hypothetical protein